MTFCGRGGVQKGERINVCVPTGNFGNILAAYYAREMGVPIGRLICASNSNNVLTDFLCTGVYDRNRTFYNTMSPSMDILISSNLERLLFSLSNHDDAEARGITDGAQVRVFNQFGEVTMKAEITNLVLPGVVDVFHGWHQADINLLTTRDFDPITGFPPFRSGLCEVERTGKGKITV